MKLDKIREIIEKTFNGSSIISFNLLSGDKITSPEYKLVEINEDGSLIFRQEGCRAESRGASQIETSAEMVESITYYPSKDS